MTEGSIIPIRLSKAAKEFNVGTSTIVEFLSKKGHSVDPNPNTKLTPEMFALIVKEYQSEKQVKEVSQKLGIEHGGRKTITAEVVTKKNYSFDDEEDSDNQELIIKNVNTSFADSRTLKVEKPSTSQDIAPVKTVIQPAEVEVQKTVAVEVEPIQPKITEPEPAPVIAEVRPVEVPEPVAPVIEAQIQVEPAKEIVAEIVTPVVEVDPSTREPIVYDYENFTDNPSSEGDLKILGKIDLDNLNMRTKPDRKSKAQRIREAEERKQVRDKDAKTAKSSRIEPVAPIIQPPAAVVPEVIPPVATPTPAVPAAPTTYTSSGNIERPINFIDQRS